MRLEEDVYERIRDEKRDDETFSDAVGRLIGGSSLLDLAGILSDEGAEEIRDVLEDVDADAVEDIDEVAGRFEESEA